MESINTIDSIITDNSLVEKQRNNSPFTRLKEAKQHIIRLLSAIKMIDNDNPVNNAKHLRRILHIQWILEQCYEAQLICHDISYESNHDFTNKQEILLNNLQISNLSVSEEEFIKIKELNTLAQSYNIKIGVNYLHSTETTCKWQQILEEMITTSKQYVYVETTEKERNFDDQQNLDRAIKEVVLLVADQVKRLDEDFKTVNGDLLTSTNSEN